MLGDGASENTIQFTNSTFYNNEVRCSGDDCRFSLGGVIGTGGGSEISCNHCTFAKNKFFCPSGDCGTFGGDTLAEAGLQNISISNSIVFGEEPLNNCFGEIVSQGYNLENGSTCLDGTVTGDKPNTDPLLDTAGLQNNGGLLLTIALLMDSPAIDMADLECPPPDTDQRGFTRPEGDRCDIGAFEGILPPPPPPPVPQATIPTLSEWGLIALAGILGIVGLMVMRRRKVTA